MRVVDAERVAFATVSGSPAPASSHQDTLKGSPSERKIQAPSLEGNPSLDPPAALSLTPMSPTAADANLMARVALGEPAARALLVRRLLRRVQRLCQALLRDAHNAQDAAQVSTLEILHSARSFRGESSLERWADRITVRTALRMSRTEKRAQRLPIDAEPRAISPAAGEEAILAQEYLGRLSERQRSVLVLRHVFEYSIEEIAEIAGISPNTVKDRLLRGRGLMRKMLRCEQLLLDAPSKDTDDL